MADAPKRPSGIPKPSSGIPVPRSRIPAPVSRAPPAPSVAASTRPVAASAGSRVTAKVTPAATSFRPPPATGTGLRTQRSMTSMRTPAASPVPPSTNRSAGSSSTGGPHRPAPSLRTQRSTSSLKSPQSPARLAPARSPVSPRSPIRPSVTLPTRTTTPSNQEDAESIDKSKSAPKSLKEMIAARRAEAKKAKVATSPGKGPGTGRGPGMVEEVDERWAIPTKEVAEEEDILGRPSVMQVVVKSLSTGSLNLTSRQLPALPSAMFSIHLGIEPQPLASQPREPPSSQNHPASVARYESRDLTILKAGDNEITELQSEIGLFGSLKSIDLSKNSLSALPASLSDLMVLTHLDLSSNSFISVPPAVALLPSLISLNLSSNTLASLSFSLPPTSEPQSPPPSDAFYAPVRRKPVVPFSVLQTLIVSNNKLTSETINSSHFPATLQKIDISSNPLGPGVSSILSSLSALNTLREVYIRSCDIVDRNLPLLSSDLTLDAKPFPALEVLDLGENDQLSEGRVREALIPDRPAALVNNVHHAAADIPSGTIRLAVGRVIIKEAWELEVERRAALRKRGSAPEQEEEDTFFTASRDPSRPLPRTARSKPVVKEPWEIEAEEGTLTEAGRRRKEAAAQMESTPEETVEVPRFPLDPYYKATQNTLSLPPAKATASRAASHIRTKSAMDNSDPFVPAQTMPLPLIQSHSWSSSLRVLELSSRRSEVVFLVTNFDNGIPALERLEELKLDGCGLGDVVRVMSTEQEGSGAINGATPSTAETNQQHLKLLVILRRLFPALVRLDLSHNQLTSLEGVDELFFPSHGIGAFRTLRLQGNRIDDTGLEQLVRVAERFLHAGEARLGVEGWKGEEIDLRSNEISKLPPVFGLLPVDVLLVEGNVFRVPARRVWERDGTKGLLQWLRDAL